MGFQNAGTAGFVRKAEKRDYDAVIKIMVQVQQMHVEWRPDLYKQNETMIPRKIFDQIIDQGTFYVAEMRGEVAGMMELLFRHVESPSHVTRNVIFIDSIAVDEAYRGMGVGHLLLDKAKELKREKAFDRIELQVNAKNQRAMEMYRNYGFREPSVNMELTD